MPGGISAENPAYDFDAGRFECWCKGETRWPLVNACMQQLNRTGYLSNRARQIVASALINELGLDWRCGAGYFEQRLIDYDVASNWGNWQYIAGVGADPRGGRHFSIEKQTRQFDADGSFVAKWLGSSRKDGANRATGD
jgi:deoxyribodipyrimidine photo-lyase